MLLEVLCFDFDIMHPHAYVSDVLTEYRERLSDASLESLDHAAKIDCIWSIAHDSYRTPLCVLFHPRLIAAASIVVGECLADGPNSPSIEDRLFSTREGALQWQTVLGITPNDIPAIAGEIDLIFQL